MYSIQMIVHYRGELLGRCEPLGRTRERSRERDDALIDPPCAHEQYWGQSPCVRVLPALVCVS